MTSLPHQTATAALDELLEVSPQVEVAVLLARSSHDLLATAPVHAADIGGRFSEHALRILDAADRARTELGREPVTQCEVGVGDGHVFVVADRDHLIAAVTATDPTVGLVFYDMKTALRAVRDVAHVRPEHAAESVEGGGPTSHDVEDDDAVAGAETDDRPGDAAGSNRMRRTRRKR